MANRPSILLTDASRAICRELGIDPDAAASSAYAAPTCWEHYLPHAQAVGRSFAQYFRTVAEAARAAAMVSKDQVEAERLKARADAMHDLAAMIDPARLGSNVVPFSRGRGKGKRAD